MSHAENPPESAPLRRKGLRRRLILARSALLLERIWPALWPAAGVVGVFLALALFDLPAQLPGPLHTLLLAVMIVLLAAAFYLGLQNVRLPDHEAARRRIETASGLSHRPLETLEDRLAAGVNDPAMRALWQAHRTRMEAAAKRLRVGAPAAGLLRRDPFALRIALLLILVVGAVDAGGDWSDRILRSLTPSFTTGATVAPVALDIWVSPPEYTGLPPQFLTGKNATQPVAVPIGSTLLAQVHGGGSVPRLVLDDHPSPFTRIDQANFKASATITAGKRLAVTQGGTKLGAWPITVVPDLPPTVAFAKPPSATESKALRLDYKATDDYGVESVKALIRRKDDPSGTVLALDLPLPGQHLKNATNTSYHDLTPHPWAGLPVEITLQATDAVGQTGSSAAVETTLPERVFHNPVARAIIEARKELTLHPDDRRPVAETLSDLSLRPAFFGNDIVVFLALRTAQARLILDRDAAAVPAVQQLLWNTALRIEDGRVSTSQRDVRQAMQALQNALARNAPDAEIDRLMHELRQAIDRHLRALAQQFQRQPMDQNMPPIDPSRMLTQQDLQRMLDRAHDLARTGAREQAEQLLSQLENMLENLRMARPSQMTGRQSQAMQAMQDMMRRQQHLLDRSFGRAHGQQGNNGTDAQDSDEQEALRQMLGDAMRRYSEQGGDIPAPMARADQAMRNAVQALRQAMPGQAVGPQTEALDALQQAAQAMSQQMMGRNGGYPGGTEPGGAGGMGEASRDPFGRISPDQGNGGLDDGGLMRMGKSPNDSGLEKAKEILEQLRQRAGERYRPTIEHNYIDRLLKQF
ncbi:MAG TPA: TIGR02302 family protein [Stellaceae bacterium]|nr:TIGR02302 family protein [Stellaceae bacterium]